MATELPACRSVLAWALGPAPALDAAVARFGRLFAEDVVSTSVEDGIAVMAATDRPVDLSGDVVWGTPSGVHVELPRDRVARTSAHLVHTLKTARGAVTAFATRGVAAVVVAGVPLRLVAERAPELLLYDFVLGDDELLDGVTVLEEASVVQGTEVRSWSPREGRLAPGPPTRAAQLVDAVGDLAASVTERDWLGATAGRDSALVVRALAARGVRGQAFTLGWPGFDDADVGASVAREVGWRHEIAAVTPLRAESAWTAIVDASLSLEGVVNPRPIALGPLDWDRRGVTWFSGHGGEIGRAFYWATRTEDEPRSALLRRIPATIPAPARATIEARIDVELARGDALGRRGVDGLDAFYALNRMRKWVGRVRPYEQIDHFWPAYLGPDLVRLLLDIPAPSRADASVFDEALALVGHRPATPAAPPTPTASPTKRRWFRRGTPATGDWPALAATLAAMGPPERVVLPQMGGAWWDAVTARARTHSASQRMVWNVIGVEAFAEWCERVKV